MAHLEQRRGRRHLESVELALVLRRGVSVAQLLGWSTVVGGARTVRYLQLRQDGTRITLRRHHVVCAPSASLLDIGELAEVDPWSPSVEDLEAGVEDPSVSHHATVGDALAAARALGADDGRWVNASVIDDEYGDLLGQA